MKLSVKSTQLLFTIIALISLVTITSLSVNYIEFWKCITSIDLSVSGIDISPIPLGATEVDRVTIGITFNLTNPTCYTGLKMQYLYYQIFHNGGLIGRETIFMNDEINPYSNKIIIAELELTEVKGEKLRQLKNASQLVWQITCVLKVDGLLGETRRNYYIFYTA